MHRINAGRTVAMEHLVSVTLNILRCVHSVVKFLRDDCLLL